MGMLSLAGIVSGAGAGAGKSLRQAQTYLNWEMLQEERGKLELARDERINENIIARENRQRAQTRADLEETQSLPFLKKEADTSETRTRLLLESKAKNLSLVKKTALDELSAKWELDAADLKHLNDVTEKNLNDPQYERIAKLTRDKADRDRISANEQVVNYSQYLHEHPEIYLAYQNVLKLTQTESQQLQLEKLQFESKHMGEDWLAVQQKRVNDVKDHESNKISHLLASTNNTLNELGKAIGVSTNETEKALLQSRYDRELKLSQNIEVRARQIFGLAPVEPIKLPKEDPKGGPKPTDGTRSTVSKHVGAAFDRRAKAVGEVADPVLDKAMEIVRRSGMFNLIPITGMVMDVPAATDE